MEGGVRQKVRSDSYLFMEASGSSLGQVGSPEDLKWMLTILGRATPNGNPCVAIWAARRETRSFPPLRDAWIDLRRAQPVFLLLAETWRSPGLLLRDAA